jgi:uncharacterized protein YcaQ
MSKPPPVAATLTLRELNRATLARQMLLQREAIDPVAAIERLAGLQAQYSPSPYIALWTRLADFRQDHLTQAVLARKVVKASLMRWTLHIASARDYPFLTRAIVEARTSVWARTAREIGLDTRDLHGKLLEYVEQPRTLHDIVRFLDGYVPPDPERFWTVIWHMASAHGWLVHAPPSGTWRYFGKNSYISAYRWLNIEPGQEPSLQDAMLHLVRRYLAAFGPASRADVMQWSGLRRVSHVDEALETLGGEISVFADEDGKVLYDLADAPRPGGDIPAPVRFLPKWDNLLLAHDNRERVLPMAYRKTVIKVNGDVMPTFLVDGIVAGMWSIKRERATAVLSLEPLAPLEPSARASLEEEGTALLRFVEPDASEYQVVIT